MSSPWTPEEGGHFRPDAFARFVANAMSNEERVAFEAHLTTCPRCRGMLAVQQRSSRGPRAITLDGLSPTVTPERGGETTLPIGEAAPVVERSSAPTDPPTPSPESSDAVAKIPDPRQNALTNSDLPGVGLTSPVQPALDPLIGRKLGDYVVQELIARGGMAAVYRGVQPVIGKQVAIKVLLPMSNEHDFAQRMVVEAQTVNAIAHPNIIDIFGAGALPDGRPYLVMEFLAGKSMAEWVRKSPGPIATEVVVAVLEQICSALDAAHRAGVVHRDIKPANIMLTQLDQPIPRVKVVDFGLAKSADANLRTAPDVVLGTPGFVSPEQIVGQRATPLSDLYSVGLCGWFMVGRTDPFPKHEHILTTMRRQLNEEPASLRGRPGVPDGLADVIADLSRIDPARRPQSAQAAVERLRILRAGTARDLPPVPLSKEGSSPRGLALMFEPTTDPGQPPPTTPLRKSEPKPFQPIPLDTQPERPPLDRTRVELPPVPEALEKTPLVSDAEVLLEMARRPGATSRPAVAPTAAPVAPVANKQTVVFDDAPVKDTPSRAWVVVVLVLLALVAAGAVVLLRP